MAGDRAELHVGHHRQPEGCRAAPSWRISERLWRVEPAPIFAAIAEHGVTHMCGAPVVLTMLIHAPEQAHREFAHTVQIATGGAAPPTTVIARMEAMGFAVTHL